MCERAAAGPESKLSRPLHSPAWQSLQTVLNSTIVAIDGGGCAPPPGMNASRGSTAMPSVMAQMRPSRKDDRFRSRSASRRNILMLHAADELGAAGRRQLPVDVAIESYY